MPEARAAEQAALQPHSDLAHPCSIRLKNSAQLAQAPLEPMRNFV